MAEFNMQRYRFPTWHPYYGTMGGSGGGSTYINVFEPDANQVYPSDKYLVDGKGYLARFGKLTKKPTELATYFGENCPVLIGCSFVGTPPTTKTIETSATNTAMTVEIYRTGNSIIIRQQPDNKVLQTITNTIPLLYFELTSGGGGGALKHLFEEQMMTGELDYDEVFLRGGHGSNGRLIIGWRTLTP